MAERVAYSKYSTVQQYVTQLPSWVAPAHQLRIAAYQFYRELYWSHLAVSYTLMNRGLDAGDDPVYVPSSRIVIDTMSRYIGPKCWFGIDPETGTPQSQVLASQTFTSLFTRERFSSRYNANKREGLTVGDWIWHIVADPEKPEGTRLSLLTVKADNYFPTYEDELIEGGDPDKLVQVRLVEQVLIGQDERVRVQLYDRTVDEAGTIYSSLTLWKPDEWFLADKAPLEVYVPPVALPSQITAFPVYHIPNGTETGEAFGSSEIRGLEVLQAALNQGVTDEDLAIALMGLGVFATDQAGNPIDPTTGEQRTWAIYPGAVIENSKGLRRVEGITTVAPYNDHLGRLEGYLADATGATDAARGRVEVQEAESGIALTVRLGPTLAKAEVAEQVVMDVLSQMFYDLTQMWLPTFEGVNFTDVRVFPTFGDKLPVNKKAEAELVSSLYVAGILSGASARKYLSTRGFGDVFDPAEAELILAEKVANAAAEQADPTVDRETNEVNGGSALNSPPLEDQ